jgi:two-component system chemotaxis sensor kinase CheA
MTLIFEAFRQADGTINRKFGGTGLGLTISKSLATLLGGEIQVESRYGEGSDFTLFLPVREEPPTFWDQETHNQPVQPENTRIVAPSAEASGEISVSYESFREKNILVCDDDMRNVFVISRILEEKGVKIVVAKNGQECLDKLSAHPDISLLLIDVMMPGMDGLTVIREIRKDEQGKHLPVIVITARAMKGDREMCITAGADDYLPKPVSPEKLIITMARLLS